MTAMTRCRLCFTGLVFAAGALAACGDGARAADPVADFYAGKTVRVLIGYTAGGGYDVYARTLARHIGRHIPGRPSLVAQNMPGAGSLKVVNYLFAVAPRDGTVIATFGRGIVIDPLLAHNEAAQFDANRFNWLGSVSSEVSVCAFMTSSGIRDWQDMQTRKTVIGSTGTGADSDIYPLMLRNLFHLPFKIVAGFPGASEVNLALERHEVDGRCGWSWVSLISRSRTLYETKQLNITLQIALQKHRDLPDLPLVTELTDDRKVTAALRLVISRQSMARPFAAPPEVPEARVRALRDAFDATMRDRDFLAEMKRQELEVEPVTGTAVQALIAEIYAAPPDVVALASAAVKDGP
jgi:tripartite-type tricarboxylate transporter receptor subunit TctC